MSDGGRSHKDLEAEIETLRAQLATLESERLATSHVLHGDPERQAGPLMEQVPAIVWTTDRELRLTWWTGGAIASIEGGRETDLGTDIYAFLETDDPGTPAIVAHREALAGRDGAYDQDLGDHHFTAHVSPLRDAGGGVVGVVGLAIDITPRVRAERELRAAHDRLRTLSGLIPICMHCKNVRNDGGFWEQVESYVRDHSEAEFTHAICPECMKRALDPDAA